MKSLNILFVCTGNTCRSPMAEAYANFAYSGEGNVKVIARSAGLYVTEDSINPNSADALFEYGIPSRAPHAYYSHVPHQITEADLKKADAVVCMNGSMARRLSLFFPEYADKITAFKRSVGDPYGQSFDVYAECLRDIINETDEIIGRLTSDADGNNV